MKIIGTRTYPFDGYTAVDILRQHDDGSYSLECTCEGNADEPSFTTQLTADQARRYIVDPESGYPFVIAEGASIIPFPKRYKDGELVPCFMEEPAS